MADQEEGQKLVAMKWYHGLAALMLWMAVGYTFYLRAGFEAGIAYNAGLLVMMLAQSLVKRVAKKNAPPKKEPRKIVTAVLEAIEKHDMGGGSQNGWKIPKAGLLLKKEDYGPANNWVKYVVHHNQSYTEVTDTDEVRMIAQAIGRKVDITIAKSINSVSNSLSGIDAMREAVGDDE